MFAIPDHHLSGDQGGLVTRAFHHETPPTVGEVVHVFSMARSKLGIVNDVDVCVPAFLKEATLLEPDDLRRFPSDAVNGLFKGIDPPVPGEVAE
jgi:hypothetical protein